MGRSIAIDMASLAMLALHAPPASAQNAELAKLKLDPASPGALLVMKTDWWQQAPSMKSAFKVVFQSFNAAEEKLQGGPYGGGGVFEAKQKKYFDGYLAVPVKPGHYVIQSYAQQDLWTLCFNANTVQFDVKPGEVVFLGELDAKLHRAELTRQTVLSGKVSIRGYGFADFFDLAEGPHFAPIDDAQLQALKDSLSRNAAQITAPIRAATFAPARFGTGSTLFAERRCGGYFSVSAKDKDAKDKVPAKP